ncbi:hypothetical protein M422DRAFT_64065 [Sphaerobolus stellatus SS14]|nr:hypothetical protein M422DRAFT_64065 [Sphaerobolus stellatus SS14]
MGFFSSRKAEPTPLPNSEQKSTVNVIRSRFLLIRNELDWQYGNKHRNDTINSRSTSNGSAPGPSVSTPSFLVQSQLQSPPTRGEASIPLNQSPVVPTRQVSVDALTMSLAEKLNDLATANADGLLGDEEYRLLRQNVFERYSAADRDAPATTSTIPISPRTGARDTSISTQAVPRPRPPRAEHPQHFRNTRTASVAPSNASIHSQRSIATAVSSIFRRATGRSHSVTTPTESESVEGSMFSGQQTTDASSIYSASQMSMSPRTNTLSRRPSNDSLLSGSQHGGSVSGDIRSPRRRMPYAASIASRATTRSAKPPSSFHLRLQSTSSTHPTRPNRTHEGDDDEDSPKSAAELREEIEVVESEGRKLLDAFNGLELTALTKSRTSMSLGNPARLAMADGQHLSVYSDGAHSALGSAYTLVPDPHAVPLVAQPVTLKRKGSMVTTITGSFKSSERRGTTVPTSMPLSNSNRNSISGKSTMTTVNGLLSTSPPLTASRSHPNLNASASNSSYPSPALPALQGSSRKRSILRPSPKRPLLPSSLRHPNASATSSSSSSSTPGPDASLSNRPNPDSPSSHHPPSLVVPIEISRPRPSKLDPIDGSPPNNTTLDSPNTTTSTSTSPTNKNTSSPVKRTAPPDPALIALEEELGEIRRRKAEVATRYEHRLEFLRAKLKSAEIRERLSKR